MILPQGAFIFLKTLKTPVKIGTKKNLYPLGIMGRGL